MACSSDSACLAGARQPAERIFDTTVKGLFNVPRFRPNAERSTCNSRAKTGGSCSLLCARRPAVALVTSEVTRAVCMSEAHQKSQKQGDNVSCGATSLRQGRVAIQRRTPNVFGSPSPSYTTCRRSNLLPNSTSSERLPSCSHRVLLRNSRHEACGCTKRDIVGRATGRDMDISIKLEPRASPVEISD